MMVSKSQILKDKGRYYTKNYPKGVKNKSGNIEIEFQREKEGMRAIVFDNRIRKVHDYYGKNKKEVLRKARKDFPTNI